MSVLGNLSTRFKTVFDAAGSPSIQFSDGSTAIAGASISTNTLTLGIGATDGSPATQLNIGDFVNFQLQIVDGGAVVHTEDVSFTVGVNPASGGNTIALLADNGAGTEKG